MLPRIVRPSEEEAVDRGGGASTICLVTPGIGATMFISGITQLEPGAAIPVHVHNCEESVVVLEGTLEADIGDETHVLRPFDTSWMPAAHPHRFRNIGSAPARILWIYASTQATRTILATGETLSIGSKNDRYGSSASGRDPHDAEGHVAELAGK